MLHGVYTTVTVHISVKLPSYVVTVITALPAEMPRTTPVVVTDAIAELLEDHEMALFVAFEGCTNACNVNIVFLGIVRVV